MNSLEIDKDGLAHISLAHGDKVLSGTMSFETLYNTLDHMFAEAALIEAKAKVAELEARLGKPSTPVSRALPRVVSQYEGTDAEFESGRDEGDGGAAEFRNEILDLRARSLAKRKRA